MSEAELIAEISTEEIVKALRAIQNSAQVVLDSGFGTHEGESDRVYRKRRDLAKNAADRLEQYEAALRAQEQNEPLTLEQAIIRIGDAVWLRLKIPGEYDGWRFLIGESGSYFVFTLASGRKEMYLKETIGSDYNLYAHEPKGADQ